MKTFPWSSGVKHEPSKEDAVAWHKASEAYKTDIDPSKKEYGQMPVNYTKDYHFYVFGINK